MNKPRIVPQSVTVYALTKDGRRVFGWQLTNEIGETIGHNIDTGVRVGEPWTLQTTHTLMSAIVADIAETVQNAVRDD